MHMEPGTYHVVVTREDIENGIRRIGNCCPVALAVYRALGIPSELNIIEVDETVKYSYSDYEIEIFSYAEELDITNFVYDFDEEKLVFPFEFDIVLHESEY